MSAFFLASGLTSTTSAAWRLAGWLLALAGCPLLAGLLPRTAAQYYTVSSYSGTNAYSKYGDGSHEGPAPMARLYYLRALATDAAEAGNVYLANQNNYRIRRISTSGIMTTVVGTGAFGYDGLATSARPNFPCGMVLNAAGSLYTADSKKKRVRRVSAGDGTISTLAGTSTLGNTGDDGPATTAQLNRSENMTVDAGTNTESISRDGGPATSAWFDGPAGLALNAADSVYVCDRYSHRTRRLTPLPVLPSLSANRSPVGIRSPTPSLPGPPRLPASTC